MKPSKIPLLVSACLVGDLVRYDGKVLPHSGIAELASQGYELFAICPEVAGGLPVPRAAAEICTVGDGSSCCCVKNSLGEDVTAQFNKGAAAALALATAKRVTTAILKEGSPSCGSGEVYDGSFSSRRVAGRGITTRLLQAHGIRVLSEQALDKL